MTDENAELLAQLEAEATGGEPMQEINPSQVPDAPAELFAPTPQAEREYREVLNPLLTMTFAVLAPNWKVTKTEIDQLTEVYAKVLVKYYPDAGQLGVEFSAVLLTGAVVLPRIRVPRVIEPEPDQDQKPEADTNGKNS